MAVSETTFCKYVWEIACSALRSIYCRSYWLFLIVKGLISWIVVHEVLPFYAFSSYHSFSWLSFSSRCCIFMIVYQPDFNAQTHVLCENSSALCRYFQCATILAVSVLNLHKVVIPDQRFCMLVFIWDMLWRPELIFFTLIGKNFVKGITKWWLLCLLKSSIFYLRKLVLYLLVGILCRPVQSWNSCWIFYEY